MSRTMRSSSRYRSAAARSKRSARSDQRSPNSRPLPWPACRDRLIMKAHAIRGDIARDDALPAPKAASSISHRPSTRRARKRSLWIIARTRRPETPRRPAAASTPISITQLYRNRNRSVVNLARSGAAYSRSKAPSDSALRQVRRGSHIRWPVVLTAQRTGCDFLRRSYCRSNGPSGVAQSSQSLVSPHPVRTTADLLRTCCGPGRPRSTMCERRQRVCSAPINKANR